MRWTWRNISLTHQLQSLCASISWTVLFLVFLLRHVAYREHILIARVRVSERERFSGSLGTKLKSTIKTAFVLSSQSLSFPHPIEPVGVYECSSWRSSCLKSQKLRLKHSVQYVEIKCQPDATDDFYCRSYCLLNMFRAPLCPYSGAREYYTSDCCLSYLVLGFQVVGMVWSWESCVRFAGCCATAL